MLSRGAVRASPRLASCRVLASGSLTLWPTAKEAPYWRFAGSRVLPPGGCASAARVNATAGAAAAGLGLSVALWLLAAGPSPRPLQCEEESSTASLARAEATLQTLDVKLITYNVLSPPLAPPNHFPCNSPSDLEPSARLPKILARLGEAVEEGAVIGLQEVDLTWAGQLHVFFAERGYSVVFAQYGKPFNGYMGVMLAWPRDEYEALDVEICRLSDTAPKSTWPKGNSSTLNPYGFVNWQGLREIIGCSPPTFQSPDEEWKWARERANEVILARLRHRGKSEQSFCVSTYHMPCFFGSPEKVKVVNIHSLLLLSRIHEFARGDPAVLLGDFNFSPRSSPYQLMLSGGSLDSVPRDQWVGELRDLDRLATGPVLPGGMESAYRAYHGKEPLFTNFAQTSFSNGPFVDTLDYIWFTPGQFKVVACPLLPQTREEVQGPFPNRLEPSDHLPLRATLRLAPQAPEAATAGLDAAAGSPRPSGARRRSTRLAHTEGAERRRKTARSQGRRANTAEAQAPSEPAPAGAQP